MQWIVLMLIGILVGLGVDSRRDLIKKAAIALIILIMWYMGKQHP